MSVYSKNDTKGTFKSVLIAYFILVLHVLLIAAMGLLVLFFRGVVNYMVWIFLGGVCLILISGYLFFRRMRKEGRTLQEIINQPAFKGRSLEVDVLGGLISLKVNRTSPPLLKNAVIEPEYQLEQPGHSDIRELTELARLLDDGLITPDEYLKAKQQLFNS